MSKMFPTIYICDVKNSGGHLFRVEKTPPRPPEKTPGGESLDSLSPGTPTLTDPREGGGGAPRQGTLPRSSSYKRLARPPHFVAVAGHDKPLGRYKVRPRGLLASGERLGWVSKG